MNTLRLYTAISCLFHFLSCVENEIETLDVAIDIQPHGSATIEPEVYGPLFPGDSISITITLLGTQDYDLSSSLFDVPELSEQVQVYIGPRIDPNPIHAVRWAPAVVRSSTSRGIFHHHFKHPTKKGIVTIPHPKKDIPKGTVGNILRQAGLKSSSLPH